MKRRRRKTSGGVSEETRRRHAWLELIQISGPFLALPVVHRVFQNGLHVVSKKQRAEMRFLVEEMLASRGATRHKVIETMLREVLDWQDHLRIDHDVPGHLAEQLAGVSAPIRPDFAFHLEAVTDDEDDEAEEENEDETEEESSDAEETEGISDSLGGEWRLLGLYMPWGTRPLDRIPGAGSMTHVDRLASLLRARQAPIGVVTDGRYWAIVWAPLGGTTGVAVWDADSFSGEPQLLDAFVALLSRYRFLSVADDDTLPRMLRESLDRQEEVTERLGEQVRAAVEMLVTKLDQLDRDQGGTLLKNVSDEEFYSGVVTFMMRIVFLLFAEERRLLPSDDATYVEGYSVGYLVDQLDKRAQLAGQQALRHRTAAWHRLLAVSRAVFAGIAHENLRLPAYGGELFDPDAYPWLEGRIRDEPVATAEPPAVDDLTVWHILRAVQFIDIGGEIRRLTFRALDVEQIGYVYEGLLELEVRTADEIMLSLPRPANWPRVKNKKELPAGTCEVALSEVLKQREEADEKDFAAWLSGYTTWSADKVAAELSLPVSSDQRKELERVIGSGPELVTAEPFLRLIRVAENGQPAVILPQGRYVTRSSRRASSGTHYTPRRLAETVVKHSLDPLVHRPGPLETGDDTQWRVRPSSEIRDLKVADIAMGSGAFLVAACRYLADKMVNAWEEEGRQDAIIAAQQRAGQRVARDSDVDVVLLEARRIIAEHCLYGVDINPLAVSMAKLSLWLITMDRERPFGFLDDRLVAGDSLLGLTSLDQLTALHVDPVAGRKLHKGTLDFTDQWRAQLERAADLRRKITAAPAITIRDIEHKTKLLKDATKLGHALIAVADGLTGIGLAIANPKGKKQDIPFINFSLSVSANEHDLEKLRDDAESSVQDGLPEGALGRTPLHWPLVFPEVFADEDQPGFDAIVGNPPFVGGQKISGTMGDNYLAWLQRWDGNGVKGSTDLAARFILRAERLLNHRGQLGLVTIKTVAEGAPMKVGLEQVATKLNLWRARSPHAWPTKSANITIVEFWASRLKPSAGALLWIDDEEVPSIGPDLQVVGTIPGRPHPLKDNEDIAFIGSYILGNGFTLTAEQREELIAQNPQNADLIQPYVIGKDLNQRPHSDASRWVINFGTRTLDEAELYPDLIDIVRRLVKPQREKPTVAEPAQRYWWRYERHRPELYKAIKSLDHILALSLVGNTLMPPRLRTGPVFAHKCVVFALDDYASLALMSSSVHASWVIRWTSTMRTDLNYSPSQAFITLPRPGATPELEILGQKLHEARQEAILRRGWKGLTDIYNKVNSSAVQDPDVQKLREIHAEIDHEVLRAYGWTDIVPNIGFHRTKIGVRWMVDRDARFQIVDRLRILNEEQFRAQG